MSRDRKAGAAVLALVVSLPGAAGTQSAPGVDSLTFSKPAAVAEMDARTLGGQPSRLAWSPDGSQLYLQALEGDFGAPDAKPHHYILAATTGALEPLQIEPEWASVYWVAKSGQSSPDDPPLKIELKTERRKERTTSLPQGGELARGGASAGITENDELSILAQQSVAVITLLLMGETVGRFENSVLVPGLTYGWGPRGSRVIAFAAEKTGRIVVMDARGKKQEVDGSKNAALPAWSPDGDRIAWLQKDGRGKYLLQVTRVSVA